MLPVNAMPVEGSGDDSEVEWLAPPMVSPNGCKISRSLRK